MTEEIKSQKSQLHEDSYFVFLFPSALILDAVTRHELIEPHKVIAVFPNNQTIPDCDFKKFSESEFINWTKDRFRKDKWLCCSELSIYFVAKYRDFAGQLNFSPDCLDMLTKWDMANELQQASIPALDKQRLSEIPQKDKIKFPIIAKPNFGFASSLVKRLLNQEELENYVSTYEKNLSVSPISAYRQEYFDYYPIKEVEEIIIEPDFSNAIFYSVPFVVKENRLEKFYPCKGELHEQSLLSDFEWRVFRYEKLLSAPLRKLFEITFDKLIKRFELRSGVFEAEFLFEAKKNNIYILEFSPRIIGGAIPDLIYYASGDDLRHILVSLFWQNTFIPTQSLERECLYMREEYNQAEPAPTDSVKYGNLLFQDTKRIGSRIFTDSIYEIV